MNRLYVIKNEPIKVSGFYDRRNQVELFYINDSYIVKHNIYDIKNNLTFNNISLALERYNELLLMIGERND